MSVFLCHACGVTILESAKGAKPECPRCRKPMVPKSGPGAIEEQFPEKAHEDTVLQLKLDNLPKENDPVKEAPPPQP